MPSPLAKLVVPLRARVRGLRKRVRKLVSRHIQLEVPQIERAMQDLIGQSTDALMMHSSLSACGYIEGGSETIIHAVEDRVRTLVMPTHTYCYPPVRGGEAPIFDPRTTPSRVGRITEDFWRQPGVLRSVHPTHSLAARGPAAVELTRDHQWCNTPCGRETPYERLVQMGASVLMFGATMNTYTLFHTAEDAAGCSYLYEPGEYDLRAIDSQGDRLTIRMLRQNMQVRRRFTEMDRPLEAAGLLRRHRLGRGQLLFIPDAGAVHEFLLERLAEDPLYLTAEARSTP